MKRYLTKILIFLTFVSLGFFISYEIKNFGIQKKNLDGNIDKENMNEEIKKLMKEKDDNKKIIDELLMKIELYEENASKQSDEVKALKKELDSQNLLLGTVDAIGEGVIIRLKQKPAAEEIQNLVTISGEELSYMVNELYFAGAEAISINDLRITSQTGIKSSDNNSFIEINGEKVSPRNEITIKVIGNPDKIMSALEFPNALDFQSLVYYDINFEKSENMKILKYNKTYSQEYVRVLNE